MPRVHARVYGLVQGVGFRHFTWQRARALGLKGWVRNRVDGTVEVVAEGPKEKLEHLVEALHRGPWGARVDKVDVTWEDTETGEFSDFDVRPTM